MGLWGSFCRPSPSGRSSETRPPSPNSSSHLRAGIVVSPERSYAFLSANVPDAKSHFIEPAAGERELGVSP